MLPLKINEWKRTFHSGAKQIIYFQSSLLLVSGRNLISLGDILRLHFTLFQWNDLMNSEGNWVRILEDLVRCEQTNHSSCLRQGDEWICLDIFWIMLYRFISNLHHLIPMGCESPSTQKTSDCGPITVLKTGQTDWKLTCLPTRSSSCSHNSSRSKLSSFEWYKQIRFAACPRHAKLGRCNHLVGTLGGILAKFFMIFWSSVCWLSMLMHMHICIWMFPKIVVPRNGWLIMENPTVLKWMIWWYPYFWKYPYIYIYIYIQLYTYKYGFPQFRWTWTPVFPN